MLEPSDHEWADGAAMFVSCVSLMSGLGVADLVGLLGAGAYQGDLANDDLELVPPRLAGRWVHPVQIAERAGWLVLIEPLSQVVLDPGMTEALSRAGALVSLWHSINADMMFLFAQAGEVRRWFDPLDPESGEGELLPQEAGLVFGDPDSDVFGHAVTLAERVSGVSLPTEWILRVAHPVYLVPKRTG